MENKEEISLMKIKYRTYLKCKRQIVIGLILIGLGFGVNDISSISFVLIIIGIILTTSSIFGILSNKLTKKQIEFIKDKT